jgi:polysaccharide biosynthesis protein PslF
VVATAFPHAIEMLADGAGSVVPHRDPQAIAQVLEQYLTHSSKLRAASRIAFRVGQRMSWPTVALAYEKLAGRVLARRMLTVA